MVRLLLIVVVSSLPTLGQAAEKKTVAEARKMLEAMGSTLADFDVCTNYRKPVRRAVGRFVQACGETDSIKDEMYDIVDSAEDARKNEIKLLGGACKGDLSERRDFIIDMIDKAAAPCD